MQNNRTNTRTMWLIVLSAVLFFGVAVVTLRAAERAVQAAPEESATISDDPTTAPDPKQSADNNVSFPTNI